MTFAITQSCCNDAHCVSVCPVNCIHPTPDEPDFGRTEMLYIDPRSCIDCGACASACPVDAIFPIDKLTAPLAHFAERNRAHYEGRPADPAWAPSRFARSLPTSFAGLRVAIIGTGPAACYTAQTVLRTTEAHVTMIDRERVAGGLVRYGVAPDHPSTKRVGETFAWLFHHPRLSLRLGTEVGADVTLAELRRSHHAVIAAVGAPDDRRLGIPGESLPGSLSAGDFSRWVNGHPDATAPDLAVERAVVVGNGNVALDVARLLVSDPETLPSELDPQVRAALQASRVREVVVLGRRGPEHAAYTWAELEALRHLPGVGLVVDDTPGVAETIAAAGPAGALHGVEREHIDWDAAPDARRIVLRFGSTPQEILGATRVVGVRLHGVAGRDLAAGLVVTSIGRVGRALRGMPFDEDAGRVPHQEGRVIDPETTAPVPGLYVVGWAKRGPTGGIGANRFDAEETVDALLDDALAGVLEAPTSAPSRRRGMMAGWAAATKTTTA